MEQKTQHLETFSSNRVRLSLFQTEDKTGMRVFTGKPAYWYTDKETGKPRWSENLKPHHLKDASVCYDEAHHFYEQFKKENRSFKTAEAA